MSLCCWGGGVVGYSADVCVVGGYSVDVFALLAVYC